MSDYYREKLSADRLKQVYDLAPPRIQQYLQAEIDYAANLIQPGDNVLELGCGYGRIILELAGPATTIVGIDNSQDNLICASEYLKGIDNYELALMDAANLAFGSQQFDLVLCLQNGISAFGLDPSDLMAEAIRVTRSGGLAVFTSYSESIWENRLQWFEFQSEAGLLGKIDYDQTGGGEIVCKDGFRATTISPEQFEELVQGLGFVASVKTVDDSFVACEMSAR